MLVTGDVTERVSGSRAPAAAPSFLADGATRPDVAAAMPAADLPGLAPERRPVLAQMVDAALTPGGRLLLVGEPGLGKSHLVDALVQSLPTTGTVLFARGLGAAAQPYAGLADLLSALPSRSEQWSPSDHRAVLADLIARQVPGDRGRVEAAVADVFSGAAGTGAVLVVDEWQWLDQETVDVLERILRRPDLGARLPVVAAGRPPTADDAAGRPPFFAADQVVRLAPLRQSSIAGILADAGLAGLPPSTLTAITNDCGGNPLWAMALATARVTGDPRSGAGGVGGAPLRRRLDAVPATLRRLLAVIALMGGARTDDLVQVCPEADTLTDEGLRRRLLRVDEGRWTVTEPMLARAAVQQLTTEDERELHLAVARLPLPLQQRAEHHDQGVAPGADEALAAELGHAARRARRAGTPTVAVRLARRALARTAETSDAWAGRAVEAAELALLTGDTDQVREFLRVLDPANLPLRVFDRAACALARNLGRTGGDTAVTRRFSELERVLVPGSAAWHVAEAHRVIALPPSDCSSAEQQLMPALSVEDTPATFAMVLTRQARRRLDQGYGVDDDLIARIRTLQLGSTVPLELTADALAAQWAYQADDVARSRTGLAASLHEAKQAGETYAVVDVLGHAATVEVLTGHLHLATALLDEAEDRVHDLAAAPPSLPRARAVLTLARAEEQALDDLLTGPLDAAATSRADLLRSEVAGLDAAAAGRWTEAAEQLEHARALADRRGVHEPGRRLWIDVELGRVLVQLRRLPEAADVAAAVHEVGSRPGRIHARGQALRLRALVAWRSGDLAAALPLSALALADLQTGPYRVQLARAQLERVVMLQSAGRLVQARGLLRSARALAGTIADVRLQAEAQHLHAELTESDGRATLTPGELRVARAVAGGQSNRDIAGDLVVSVRTVETHLAHAYRKLGVHTRTQLALALNDHPLDQSTG